MVRIELRGVSGTPGDGVAPEGDLETSLGLVNEDGTLRPVGEPERLAHMGGASVVFVHRPSDGSEVLVLDSGRWSCGDRLGSLGGVREAPLPPGGGGWDSGWSGESRRWASVGNTLCCATPDGVMHWLWKDGAYVALGERPELPVLEFDLRDRLELTDGDTVTLAECPAWTYRRLPRVKTSGNSVYRPRTAADDAARDAISDAVLGVLLKSVRENVTQKGRFWQPFFVRYAFRLYDGTYAWHSSPVLMLAPVHIPLVVATRTEGSEDGEVKVTFGLDRIPHWRLHRRIASASASLADWGDVVTGLEVFVSAPIWTFRQGEGVEKWLDTTRRAAYARLGREENLSGEFEHASKVYLGHWEGEDRYAGIPSSFVNVPSEYEENRDKMLDRVWALAQNGKFEDEVRECGLFYRYDTIELGALKAGGFEAFEPKDKDLTNLQARAALPDEYLSHARLLPDVLESYNSRLHAAGLRIGSPAPFAPGAYGAYTEKPEGGWQGYTEAAVWSRRDGVRTMARRESAALPSMMQTRYVYVPDPGAYAMAFRGMFGDTELRLPLELKPHPTLNGAYWWGGLGERIDAYFPVATDVSETYPSSAPARNKVYVSEAGNPFVFRAEAVVTVGQSEVKALAAAARPLSEGQFGQFPLYAFTDEGVWALETSATGSYSARQPVTRDVLSDGGGIVSLDTSVAFVSERGVMRLSGRQAECLSDAFSLKTRPCGGHSALPGLYEALRGGKPKPGWRPSLPDCGFREYLDGARLAYDYAGQRLYVLRADKDWGWVLSLRTGLWGQTGWSVGSVVSGGYPDTLVMDSSGWLVRVGGSSGFEAKATSQLLVTRPLRLGDSETVKTVRALAARGGFAKGSVRVLLWGSRDLREWVLVHSSRDHLVRGISGSGYRWVVVGVLAELGEGDYVGSLAVDARERKTRLN